MEVARSFHVDALRIWQELKAPQGMIAGLEDLGLLAAAQGQARRAACLLGAAEVHLETFGLRLKRIRLRLPLGSVNVEVDHYMAGLRAALGEKAVAARLAEGRKMPLEQAVAYALSDEDT